MGPAKEVGLKRKKPSSSARVGERFACEICNKMFKYRYCVDNHRRVHTGSNPFRCTEKGCDRVFKWRSSLKSHMQTHREVEVSSKEATDKGWSSRGNGIDGLVRQEEGRLLKEENRIPGIPNEPSTDPFLKNDSMSSKCSVDSRELKVARQQRTAHLRFRNGVDASGKYFADSPASLELNAPDSACQLALSPLAPELYNSLPNISNLYPAERIPTSRKSPQFERHDGLLPSSSTLLASSALPSSNALAESIALPPTSALFASSALPAASNLLPPFPSGMEKIPLAPDQGLPVLRAPNSFGNNNSRLGTAPRESLLRLCTELNPLERR
ncbi:hypothetical protein NDN08_002926 [Rhodosorus marinus]|uniref:C2H2-type domain-containing protein n=1 Tax=Rhodosorus marinus TaxID=101924 RepID=A0AAV8UXT3_9RHOD|nr:hypothetical protein NDN08_002926 [Rhodosorus marinus]